MALVVCTVAVRQGGYSLNVGDIIDSTNWLVTKFPNSFSKPGDTTVSGTLGPVLHSTSGGSLYRIIVNSGGTLSTEVAT